jgi:hypothetical protein
MNLVKSGSARLKCVTIDFGRSKMTLNSDELGAKGESHFREICADAKLVCNKSDRERTGWDFLVEFPSGSDRDPLDLQHPMISSLI